MKLDSRQTPSTGVGSRGPNATDAKANGSSRAGKSAGDSPPFVYQAPDKDNGKLFKRLLGLTWAYRRGAIATLTLQLILLGMALTGLGLTGLGIDVLHASVDSSVEPPVWPFGIKPPAGWTTLALVGLVSSLILGVASLRFVLDRTNSIIRAHLVHGMVADLRQQIYAKMQRLPFRFFDTNRSGSIINRVTGDVQMVRMFVDQVAVQIVQITISLTVFLFYMLNIHVALTLACLATTPILAILTNRFGRRVKPAYRKNRELFDDAVLVLSENIQGQHVVKGFGLQDQQIQAFRRANLSVRQQSRWIFKQGAIFVPLINTLPQINLIVLLLFGGYLYIQGEIALGGGLFVFAGLLGQFSNQVGMLGNINNTMQRSLISAARVFEVLDEEIEIESKPGARALPQAAGRVEFQDVSFRYAEGDPMVLEGVNLVAEPGQTVAILGATGSGKSSLLSLIPRFYDPSHGRVLIDGHDAKDLDLDDLRRKIGLVFQESFLFSQSVAENIAFGHPDATPAQIQAAAKLAQAHDFIMELPEGYDSKLGEGGCDLSGGQRQRLAIARALLLEPPILLLDDPTASIDPETEHEILDAMAAASQGRTTFVVAHRLSTLRRADQVIVLDHGRVVQRGTHQSLIGDLGLYSQAASLQLPDDRSLQLLGMQHQAHETAESTAAAQGGCAR